MLDRIVPDTLMFSPEPLPRNQHRLDCPPEEGTGNPYNSDELKMVGWLCPRAPIYLYRGNVPLAPSRRTFVRSIGLLAVAALSTRMTGAPSTRDIVVVDGWILAGADLR